MKEKTLIKLERKIVIGMIIDTKFLAYLEPIIDIQSVQSNEARLLMTWIVGYFRKYKKAPSSKIQDIYEDHLDKGKIQDAQAKIIEEILQDLSDEVKDWDPEDVGYLQERSLEYINECKLRNLCESIDSSLDSGDLDDARQSAQEYKPIQIITVHAVEPLKSDEQIKAVFASRKKSLIHYPGTLGQVLDPHMVKQGFVIYLAQNKGGKSFHLMDAGLRGAAQGKKVFIVQAGDMGQVEMERRMAIYATMNSDQEKYCGVLYIPVVDCVHNQMGTCEMGCRIVADQESPFEEEGSTFLENDVTFAALREAHTDFPRYRSCQECRRSKETIRNFKGAVWYVKRPRIEPLVKSSYIEKRNIENKKFYSPFHGFQNIRISTHSNESLSMSILDNELDILEDEEGFVPEIIVADYLDLFMPDPDTRHMTFRDQENKKWQRGRRLSQDRDVLFISASQSDAEGFNKKLLDKTNFSEDRRKLDHVTAMLGINMTIQEKMMGVARLNEIVARETEGTGVVTILHRLQMGRPILGSYF